MQYFNIQMASQLSGVATATIRAWEKRYQALSPKRAENKHRLYSEDDIEKLSLLARLTDFGQNIGKIAGLDLEELKKIYSILLRKPYRKEDLVISGKENLNFHKSLSSLSLAIDSLKMEIIVHELKKIRQALDARDVAINIIPSLYKMIETKLLSREITRVQQQLLYQIISQHFSPYLADYDYPNNRQSPILLAGPKQLSLRTFLLGASLLFTHHKKNFFLLGNVSAQDLGEGINQFNSSTLLLEVQNYQLAPDYNLDHYLDEVARIHPGSLQTYIFGPAQLKQSIRRKNFTLIQGLQELDQLISEGIL